MYRYVNNMNNTDMVVRLSENFRPFFTSTFAVKIKFIKMKQNINKM